MQHTQHLECIGGPQLHCFTTGSGTPGDEIIIDFTATRAAKLGVMAYWRSLH